MRAAPVLQSHAGALDRVVRELDEVERHPEVAHGDVVDVLWALVEGGADLDGVAEGLVHAIVPVAEVTGGRIQVR